MDPLSVAASVVGLLTAAGKVYTLLDGLVASIKNAPKSMQEAQNEVKHIEVALYSLQRFVLQLDLTKPQRRALIPVYDLTAMLADAMMSFSEFESTLQLLATQNQVRTVINWANYKKHIDEHLARSQRHKASITMMLKILQWCVLGDSPHKLNSIV